MDNKNLCDIFKVILSSLYVEKLNDNEETKTPSAEDNKATKPTKTLVKLKMVI